MRKMSIVAAILLTGASLAVLRVGISAAPSAEAGAIAGANQDSSGPPPSVILERVGQLGGAVNDVAIVGHLAYLTVGPRLQVWDAATPDDPQLVGQSDPLSRTLHSVAASGTVAWALEAERQPPAWRLEHIGLRVFDVRDPTLPAARGLLATDASVRDIAAGGSYAYVATALGISVVAGGDVGVPRAVSTVEGITDALSVELAGDRLFVTGTTNETTARQGLFVVEVTEPTRPLILGFAPTGRYPLDVAVVADIGLVVSGCGTATDTLHVFNLASGPEPESVAAIPLNDCSFAVAAHGSTAFVLERFFHPRAQPQLVVVDISDPTAPRQLAEEPVWGYGGLELVDDFVYLPIGADGLEIIDGRPPATSLPHTYMDVLGHPHSVALRGTTAFVTDWYGGVWSLDLSDPSNPRSLGHIPTEEETGAILLEGDLAYVAQSENMWWDPGGLKVLDVSEPFTPTLVTTLYLEFPTSEGHTTYSDADELVLDGTDLYFPSGRNAGMWLLDVSVPVSPTAVMHHLTPGEASNLVVSPPNGYIAAGSAGIQVVDMTQPPDMPVIGEVDTPGWATDLVLVGEHLVVADGGFGLRVIAIGDPREPREVAALETLTASHVELAGGRIYVSASWLSDGGRAVGVVVFDAGQPAALVEVGRIALPGTGRILPTDDLVAVAAGEMGLLLLHQAVGEPVPPTPTGQSSPTPRPTSTAVPTWPTPTALPGPPIQTPGPGPGPGQLYFPYLLRTGAL